MKTTEEKILIAALDEDDDKVELLVHLLNVSEKDRLLHACSVVVEACEL